MRRLRKWKRIVPALALLVLTTASISGCAAALVAGGVVGGYAIAKSMEDSRLAADKKKEEGNKGWFNKGRDN